VCYKGEWLRIVFIGENGLGLVLLGRVVEDGYYQLLGKWLRMGNFSIIRENC